MVLKILPANVQSLLLSSLNINCFTKATEELMYNALDAGANSIAVRVNIDDKSIQVIDNGIGIAKIDMKNLGEKYMTSKCTDMSTLKSIPNLYGYKGLALASIINTAREVNIISRHQSTNETWEKSFHCGKERHIIMTSCRPSKGTTVQIKGLFYNLPIQEGKVCSLNEVQNIKRLLEQLSLAHTNVSISLRDDTNSAIIFKMHKCRDIFQNIKTIFDIDEKNIQELSVEKNNYKVVAYMDKESNNQNHWIYLNKRYISYSKLYKIFDDLLANNLNKTKLKDTYINKNKLDIKSDDTKTRIKHTMPFYLIFLTCPYEAYDISKNSKDCIPEFQNWDVITKLLEKLVKFYAGELNVKPVENESNKDKSSVPKNETRDKVKQIIQNVLGKQSKISQMKNGVKGKVVKRKHKKINLALNKLITTSNTKIIQKDILSKCLPNITINTNISNRNNKVKLPKSREIDVDDFMAKIIPKSTMNKKNTKQKMKLIKKTSTPNMCIRESIDNTEMIISEPVLKTQVSIPKLYTNTSRVTNINMLTNEGTKTKNYKVNTSNIVKSKSKSCHDIVNQIQENKIRRNVFHPPRTNKFCETKIDSEKRENNEADEKLTTLMKNNYNKHRKEIVNKSCKKLRNNNILTRRSVHKVIKNDQVCFSKAINKINELEVYINKCLMNCDTDINKIKNRNDLINTVLLSQSILKRHSTFIKTVNFHQRDKDSLVICNPFIDWKNFDEKTHLKFEKNKFKIFEKNNVLSTYNSHNIVLDQFKNSYTTAPRNQTLTETTDTNNMNQSKIQLKSIPSHRITYKKTKVRHNYKINYTTAGYNNVKQLFNGILLSISDIEKFNNKKSNNKSLLHSVLTKNIHNNISTKNYRTCANKYTPYASDNSSKCVNKLLQNESLQKLYNSLEKNMSNDKSDYCSKTVKNILTNSNINTNISTSHVIATEEQRNYDESSKIESFEPLNICKAILEKSDCYSNANKHVLTNSNINTNISENHIIVTERQINHSNNIVSVEPLNISDVIMKSHDLFEDDSHNVNISEQHIVKEKLNSTYFITSSAPLRETQILQSLPSECLNENLNNRFTCIESNHSNKNVTNSQLENIECKDIRQNAEYELPELIEHHLFNSTLKSNQLNDEVILSYQKSDEMCSPILSRNLISSNITNTKNNKYDTRNETDIKNKESSDKKFNFKDRPRFVPKGMSPIYSNCNTRNNIIYENTDADYFDIRLYNEFEKGVDVASEIFEAKIQDINELVTKEINRANNRIQKETANVVFDSNSLKCSTILGQVDNKFIAAKITRKGTVHKAINEYLVLLDQHAVHERIRLENNLKDYITGGKWKSVSLESFNILLTTEEALYMHNYKDKFSQFGLEWRSVNNREISITAIPQAIISKNIRNVDIIIKAVKKLIQEQVQVLKDQKGSLSLYAQTIMELVYSEACRYAIKFGDKLSKTECSDLMNSLQKCKTPFQCAHGRPVLAVLLELKNTQHFYRFDPVKLQRFKKYMK